MGTLNGRIAVVTGGRGGIGRAVCGRFEAEGATVYAADLDPAGSLGDADAPDQWNRLFAVNVTGTFLVSKHALPLLRQAVSQNGGGGTGSAIINFGSYDGFIADPQLAAYCASKGAVELQQAVRDVHPLRTYGTPTDIANLVHWRASDEARYASGQLWVLDGGLSAQVQQMRFPR